VDSAVTVAIEARARVERCVAKSDVHPDDELRDGDHAVAVAVADHGCRCTDRRGKHGDGGYPGEHQLSALPVTQPPVGASAHWRL